METIDYAGGHKRAWRTYRCARCGGVVTAAADGWEQGIREMYPSGTDIDIAIPERARTFLAQARNSLSSPSGAIMLCASAVDAMLKAKSLRDGSLYSRIDKAAENHLITAEMAKWAHEVRLDANDQRHADDNEPLPESADATKALDFALALAQFMFVLPSECSAALRMRPGNPEEVVNPKSLIRPVPTYSRLCECVGGEDSGRNG